MKILIVDDEPRHCRGMATMIQSTRPHAKLTIAKDGVRALAAVQEERPDIILTDIRMPNMDGLALLREIQEIHYKPKVIMLSAYNLFDYAQNALRYGAYDYILKPVDIDKLEEVLTRAEAQLSKEAAERREAELIRERLTVTTNAHHRQLAFDWLSGNLSAKGRQELDLSGMPIGEGTVVLNEYRPLQGVASAVCAEEVQRDIETAWSRFGETFGVVFPIPLVEKASNDRLRIATIIHTSRNVLADQRLGIRAVLESLGEKWGKAGSLTHAVGPESANLAEEVPLAYRSAMEASRYLFYDRWKGILFADELTRELPPFVLDEEAVNTALKRGDISTARNLCHAAFELFAGEGHTDPALIKEYASFTLMKLKNGMGERLGAETVKKITEASTKSIPSCEKFSELISMMDACFDEAESYWSRLKLDKRELVIDNCVVLIQERYMEDLSLEAVAARYHFNVSYFSTLFKNRTGKSFSDYLNEVRMKRAKELLAGGEMKIYEIAAACGYKDTKYFSRVFKKHAGMSPESFRHLSISSVQKGDTP
ncbi:response regulator transcription factor [Paenibacillus macerans]|uniref:response regulator transcription factor n=1 Tax=Paenibacillus macerans TaxID=44252 RepID=UPI003D3185FC